MPENEFFDIKTYKDNWDILVEDMKDPSVEVSCPDLRYIDNEYIVIQDKYGGFIFPTTINKENWGSYIYLNNFTTYTHYLVIDFDISTTSKRVILEYHRLDFGVTLSIGIFINQEIPKDIDKEFVRNYILKEKI